ncbi:MAG TPA: urea carboxylase-associated family protein, partial [Verrucomicrobiae bacterium]|nr:urea carboxylase-associated family protein [Verrucomicrobiae bacterium]
MPDKNVLHPGPADAVYSHDVPAERPWSRLLKRGQTLRIVDIEGQQAVDALLYRADDPAERPWSRLLKRGQTLRIVDIEGQQAVDALLYSADDPAERYSAQDTLRVQGSAYIGLGTRLVSNRGRSMARITADTCGRHDTAAGC